MFFQNRSLYRESCFSRFLELKISEHSQFPNFTSLIPQKYVRKKWGLIVTKCEKFQIALRRWCSRSQQGMENPGKLIIIFLFFTTIVIIIIQYYFCIYHYCYYYFIITFFFIYRSKLRIDLLLHLLCPGHPRERNDRSAVILASEIYLQTNISEFPSLEKIVIQTRKYYIT